MAARSYNENGSDMATAPPNGYYNSDMDHSNINHSIDQSELSDHADQPRYLNQLARGRAANFFINGDVFFPAKKVVYNPKHFRDFTHYMDYLTDKLEPNFGAVRKICTPHHGHRIRDLRDLQENGVYVVAGKERFKPYQYEQIMSYDKRRLPNTNYNADQVFHNRQYVTSGRIKKCETQSILIKVWPNGGDLKGPRRVLLTPRVRPFTLRNVLTHVNEILKEDLLGTVERLHFLTGVQVSDVDQITHNGQYVACRRTEKFKRARYSEHGTKNLSTSPRPERRRLTPLFPRISNSIPQSSAEQSNTSTQSSVVSNSQRRRAPRADDQVFPVKPIKHSRSSERTHSLDSDKEQNGAPKPRQHNRYFQEPRMVQTNQDNKSDVPAYQLENGYSRVPAYGGYKMPREQRVIKPIPPSIPKPHKQPSPADRLEQQDNAATKIQAAYRGHQIRQGNKYPKPTEVPQQNRQYPTGDRLVKEDTAASKIQAAYRGHQARKELKSQKPQKTITPKQIRQYAPANRLEYEDAAAAKIQAAYRGHQTRKQLKSGKPLEAPKQNIPNYSSDRLEDADKAATKIQAAYRGHQTRKQFGGKDNQPDPRPQRREKDQAAAKIQAGYRGYRQRKSLGAKKPSPEDEAAAKIQAGYRGYQTRKQFNPQKGVQEGEEAAIKIQASYRGYQTRKRMANEEAAATKIQSSYRGYVTRKNLDPAQKEADEAAAKIQAGYRGYMTRKQLSGNQPPSRNDDNERLARVNEAALTIQSHYRGYRTRQDLAEQSAVEN